MDVHVQIHRVDLTHLTATQLAVYEPFLLSTAFIFIRNVSNYPLMLGVEALKEGNLVGFALAVCEFQISDARLASLFVTVEERDKGLGTDIFGYIEKELAQEGCVSLCTEYADDSPTKEAFEKILSKCGWSKPYVYMVCCTYEIRKFNPPWFRKKIELPDSFQEFNWKDLKEGERERLRYQANQCTFHPSVSPFAQEQKIEHINSLGLRHKNEVVGWMITHRQDPDTIVYAALYLDRRFHRTKYGLRMLIDAIKLQQQSHVLQTLFRVNLEQVERSWLYFVKRRLVPYAQKVQRIKWSWRRLA